MFVNLAVENPCKLTLEFGDGNQNLTRWYSGTRQFDSGKFGLNFLNKVKLLAGRSQSLDTT